MLTAGYSRWCQHHLLRSLSLRHSGCHLSPTRIISSQLMNNNGFAVQKKSGIYIVNKLDYFVGSPGQAGQPPQPRSGPYWVSVKDSLVSIDVTNAALDRILPDIIRQLNTDVVFYSTLSGNVTVRATGISMVRALNMLLRNS